MEWTYSVPSEDLVAPIVGASILGVASAIAGCELASLCYCLELNPERLFFLVTFFLTSLIVESIFASNILSYASAPLLVGGFVTTNANMPPWMYEGIGECGSGSDCSAVDLHVFLMVFGAFVEAGVALYRARKAKHWITFSFAGFLFGLTAVLYATQQALNIPSQPTHGGPVHWTELLRSVLVPAMLIVARAVAAATIGDRRRTPPPTVPGAAGPASLPLVALAALVDDCS